MYGSDKIETELMDKFNKVAAAFQEKKAVEDCLILQFPLLMKLAQENVTKDRLVAAFSDLIVKRVEENREYDFGDERRKGTIVALSDVLLACGGDYLRADFSEKLNRFALSQLDEDFEIRLRGNWPNEIYKHKARVAADIAARAEALVKQQPKENAAVLPHDVPVTTPLTQKPRVPQ